MGLHSLRTLDRRGECYSHAYPQDVKEVTPEARPTHRTAVRMLLPGDGAIKCRGYHRRVRVKSKNKRGYRSIHDRRVTFGANHQAQRRVWLADRARLSMPIPQGQAIRGNNPLTRLKRFGERFRNESKPTPA